MFAVTNIDDLVVLAVFFGRAGRRGTAIARVCIGQYVGFAAIVVASVFGALGANLLPHNLIPYLGLLPLLLGVRAAWQLWRQRQTGTGDDQPRRRRRPLSRTSPPSPSPTAVTTSGCTCRYLPPPAPRP